MSRTMRAGTLGVLMCLAVGFPIASGAGLAPDTDSDGVPDVLDKCMVDSRNAAAACDADCDGYGNVCDGDFNQSGTVASVDFIMFFVPSLNTGVPSSSGTT